MTDVFDHTDVKTSYHEGAYVTYVCGYGVTQFVLSPAAMSPSPLVPMEDQSKESPS